LKTGNRTLRMPGMIITIDGPAGTGKSTVSRAVAQRLGFDFLDTGAMYRAVALEAIRRKADLNDEAEVARIARDCRIEFDWSCRPPEVILNGEPAGRLLRSEEVTAGASKVAVAPGVRARLVEEQQRIGAERANLVSEGRDQGSMVFPDARLKIYLDATPRERARRRAMQLRERGEVADERVILEQIMERDHRDSTRATGPLSVPKGAEVIDTTPLTEQEVIDRIVSRAKAVLG